jgi:hypothetical protein
MNMHLSGKVFLPLVGALWALCSSVQAELSSHFCPDALAVAEAVEPIDRGEMMLSVYTHHFSNTTEHESVVMLAADEHLRGDRLCGISLFNNSFGQPSVYVYAGQQFNNLWGISHVFAKVTAGLMYGYVAPYENKVPLNYKGFNPAIIPSLGYKLTAHDSVQLMFLGKAALMFSYGRQF